MSAELKGKRSTVSTQTEWSWLQDLNSVGRMATPAFVESTPKERLSSKLNEFDVNSEILANEDDGASMEDNDMEIGDDKIGRDYIEMKNEDATVRKERSGASFEEKEEEEEANYSATELVIKEHGGIPHTDGSRALERDEGGTREWEIPIEIVEDQIDDLLVYDSDSESSGTETPYDEESPFPSVGLPQMLEYLREKTSIKSSVNLKEAYKSHFGSERGFYKSFFSGPCQFCGEKVLPLPTVHEIKVLPSSELFCCGQYEEFVKLYITYQRRRNTEKEVIDIEPHAPFGSKAARKAAKERAAERMREKEMEKQKAATAQASFFNFARQVKTIQYALSSQKCLLDGWTIVPKIPKPEPIVQESQEFSVEYNTSLLQKKDELYEKFYDNGNRFLVLFPDGTGCCYYPSGNIAVIIISYDEGKYHYLLQKDSSDYDIDDPGILGSFEPSGKASCYFKDGSLRLVLNPHYGIQLDKNGNYKKKWRWHFIKGHVHTPPFQPICFALNKQMSCRVMEQDHIVVTFTSDRRTVRFNVGAKLKAIKQCTPTVLKYDEDEQFIDFVRKKVQNIQDKMQLMLRFPKSPKLDVLISKKERNKMTQPQQTSKLQLPKLKGKEPSVVVN